MFCFFNLKNDKISQLPLEKDKTNFQESLSLAYSQYWKYLAGYITIF